VGSPLPTFGASIGIPVYTTWANRRYDARGVEDPGYTATVREGFDQIADLSGAEGRDWGALMGPLCPGNR
jgi:hypothetical protein